MSKAIPFYPTRPCTGYVDDEEDFAPGIAYDASVRDSETPIYRPKLDGSRVLVDRLNQCAWNRHGDLYSKQHLLPWDELDDLAMDLKPYGHPVPNLGVRYLDIEFLDKHKEYKHKVALIDMPEREVDFFDFMRMCNDLTGASRCGAVISHTPNVLILPYYDPLDPQVDLLAQWNWMKKRSKNIMERDGETTPFYEGWVAVERTSHYVKQYEPKKVSRVWTKFRYSK